MKNTYEHRQCPADPKLVQVRTLKPIEDKRRGRYLGWSTYMLCDTEGQARHVLHLLQSAAKPAGREGGR